MGWNSPIKWFDLFVAALLVFIGGVMWGWADAIAGYFVQERVPDKEEFLARKPVRNSEFALKRVQAELESTRAKWIEPRLVAPNPWRR
jgi:hypothetical protein